MTAPRPELPEKDFIQEGYAKNPFPLWLWFFLLTIVIALLWGSSSWYTDKLSTLVRSSPFLQVTNRQISLFLWQSPEYMRANVANKNGYLPGFQYLNKITMDLAYADQYATAPPELLFRYHTWNRLLKSEFTERPISIQQFRHFLAYAEEWTPQYWPAAPSEYKDLVDGLDSMQVENLATLPLDVLPIDVRIAFQGWQNYFIDAESVNAMQVTKEQMRQFLQSHPNYVRNYWRNIVDDVTPKYLVSIESGAGGDNVPADEIAAFLRVAVYNYLAAKREQVAKEKKEPSPIIKNAE